MEYSNSSEVDNRLAGNELFEFARNVNVYCCDDKSPFVFLILIQISLF